MMLGFQGFRYVRGHPWQSRRVENRFSGDILQCINILKEVDTDSCVSW